jgi:hypothetical protein
MRSFIYLSILILVFTTGCSKSGAEINCDKLKSAMVTNDVDKAKEAFTAFISHMQDRNYTEQNLQLLASDIDGGCDLNATILCFDCIQTLPGQTEFMLSFQSGSTNLSKVIDISYTPDNKIIFRNMHD